MKKKKKKRLRMRHVILLFFVIYISIIMLNQKKLMGNLQSKKTNIEGEINTLEKEIDYLNKEIANSDSLEFVEKTAREELGMVKPREIIYIDEGKKENSFFKVFKRDSN